MGHGHPVSLGQNISGHPGKKIKMLHTGSVVIAAAKFKVRFCHCRRIFPPFTVELTV